MTRAPGLRIVLLAMLVVAASLLASGCRKVVSEDVMEQVVADLMLTVSGEQVTADCPAGVTMETDNDFFCRTEVHGREGTVLVRQLDDYGRVELENESPLRRDVIEPLVEGFLRRSHDRDVSVTCPELVIQEPDENFYCRIDGSSERVEVRQVDGIARYSYNYTPAPAEGEQ